jgi:4-amino-4-deoxy-L-arabinose transferase-like glycosyltransferase
VSVDLNWNRIKPSGATGRLELPLLLGLYVSVWTCTHGLMTTNLDGYADMLENYAWGQTIDWGSFKHPPLVSWVAGFWFRLFPTQDSFYFLLSYAASALGLLGIHRLARVAGLGRLAMAAVLLQMFALPYSTLAAKFNANTVLLPLWPWVACAWWVCVHGERKTWSMAVLLGMAAALSLLGKYYSGVLLLALALLTLALPEGRRWLATGKPWLALIVMGALLLPHLVWLSSHDYITFRYLGQQGGDGLAWDHWLRFAAAPLLYWGIALVVCVTWFSDGPASWWRRAWLAWQPKGRDDALFWVVMLPYLLTLLFGLSGLVELSLPWAIPIGFGFPILWLRNLSQCSVGGERASHLPLRKSLIILLLLVPGGGLAEAVRASVQGIHIAYLPRREAARALLSQWDALHPSRRPHWVGGLWAENAALAFYGDQTLRMIPGMPDELPASLNRTFVTRWSAEPGLIYCPPMARNPHAQGECEAHALRWLQARGLPIQKIEFEARRAGWRFPLSATFHYVGYVVVPVAR